jgi:sugar lactone lactonase YvrE
LRVSAPVLLALATLATLALLACSASAAVTHEFRASILETEPGVSLGQPVGLALDAAGDLYVADAEKEAVDRFSPSNVFLAPQLNNAGVGGTPFTGPFVLSVTVDNLPGPNQGMVYVAESNHEFVDVFKPEGGGKYKLLQERKFGGFMGVAFDNSSGPNAGKLYVFAQGQVVRVTVNSDGTLPESEEEPGVVPLPAPPLGFGGGTGSLAVGPTGGVYFANTGENAVDVYSNEGLLELAPITGAETPAGAESFQPVAVGVDPANGEVYVADSANSLVDEFSTEGTYLGQIKRGFADPRGVVVNTSGEVYVSDRGAKAVERFGPDAPLPFPLATTLPAIEVHVSSAVLNGTVNPEGVALTDCHFDYIDEADYHPGGSNPYAAGTTAPCTPSPPTDTEPHAVQANIMGLEPGTNYHFRLQASNANGTEFAQDETLSTPPKPTISGETATNLTSSTVDLNAKIDPGGQKTTCSFEYGTDTGYGTSLPCNPEPGEGTTQVAVTQHVAELEADTLYHWRVIASSGAGITTGVDHTFIYPTNGSGRLLDGRAYEMVTPPVKNAALIGDVIAGRLPDFSPDGSRLVLTSLQCFADARSCVVARGPAGTSYAFSRRSDGWKAKALAPPSAQFEVNTVMNVNPDDGTALFSIPTPPTGQDDIYTYKPDGTLTDIGPATPPELGAHGPLGALDLATGDFSRVAIQGANDLWPFDETPIGAPSVIEYLGSGGSHPVMVGVSGGTGSHELISVCGTELGAGRAAATGSALSSDGRTVFFTATQCGAVNGHAAVPADEVWARVDESESVQLSKSECEAGGTGEAACRGAEAEPAYAVFQGASADGARAFFTSTQQLTDNASEDNRTGDSANSSFGSGCSKTAGASGCNLYEYGMTDRRLVAVSAGAVSGGPRVQGVMAISSDGSHVYFVARGVLSAVANARGMMARDGGANLYVSERDGAHPQGVVRFIATLSDINAGGSGSDRQEWSEGADAANVSSDGRYLVFTSQAPLTGDDTSENGGPAQVFRYDDATTELVRVSVGEGGFNDNGNAGVGDATIVRGSALTSSAGGSGRRDPSMSDDGRRVFFMSPIALVPGALDDVVIAESGRAEYAQNIYEFEEGRVSLISSGRDVGVLPNPTCNSVSATCLVGSDVTGDNVFFTTTDHLVPGDTDTQLDFYDARVCTASSPCVGAALPQAPGCSGEVCHGVPIGQPGVPGGGSSTLSGLGNVALALPPKPTPKPLSRAQRLARALRRCRRSHVRSKRRRLLCKRAARKHYGAKNTVTKKTVRKTARKAVRADAGWAGAANGEVR